MNPLWPSILMGKEAPKIHKRNETGGSTKTQKVLLVNYTLGIEIGIWVPDLLSKPTAASSG